MTQTETATAVAGTGAARLEALLAELTLEEKVALISGADFWTTTPIERIGLRAMVLSDGPAGVRGPVWDERSPSLNLPSGSALAASWDPEFARRYGEAAGVEARRKDVDVVLGPTINLHRSPLGGRHFECLSEDPELSGALAAEYVRGVQSQGVAATPKHYVANDSETDRFTVDVRADERTLREVYLPPFERAVGAGAWAIMSAYNSVDGVTMTENELLETPLNSEWGFDGVVVSDWTAVRSLASATASQDLAMPGPAPAWSGDLVEAVLRGDVPVEAVDRKVLRLLALAERVGALAGAGAETHDGGPSSGVQAASAVVESDAAESGTAFAREASREGTVLLRNAGGELPWDAASLRRIAVIGHNAQHARTQGGGSATVIPEHTVSPLEGLRAALPGAEVEYSLGAVVQEGVAEIPVELLTNPDTGGRGLAVAFLDGEGRELFREDRFATALVWFGGDAPIAASESVVLRTVLTSETTGRVRLGFAGGTRGRIHVDGALLLDDEPVVEGTDLGAAFLAPPSTTAELDLTAGVPVEIRAEFELYRSGSELDAAFSVTLGLAPADADPEELIADAARAAAAADVALVVVGTNSKVESEGYDRSDLALPGRQDDLVRAVAAANPRTVVVVNAGAPVLLPWRDEVAAVLLGYFGGQEFGAALADVLLGAAEPGGRLPTTWPGAIEDVPVLDVTPRDGVLEYTEGLHIGYRAWLRQAAAGGAEPAYPFGFGLGYTSWELSAARIEGTPGEDAAVVVSVANTGERSGKQVVQVYAERPGSAVDRPVRWLVGFAPVRAGAGEAAEVRIPLTGRSFAHWDGVWALEPGTFTLRAGFSAVDLPLSVEAEVR